MTDLKVDATSIVQQRYGQLPTTSAADSIIDPRFQGHPSSWTLSIRNPENARHASLGMESHTPQQQQQQQQGHSGQQIQQHHQRNGTIERPRELPPRDINDDSMDDAYVQFIMYCNPSIPQSTDVFELKKGFRSPPKSDGKTFSTFVIFQLIRKLELKEVSTWTQLVMELGVEPPDAAKNQSTQKIQQYAVRLKRWLHAFHVDAFFYYCLEKPNQYYSQVPDKDASYLEDARDGVPPEEDLALRALLPEWRPKRGRRKADDNSNDPNKRQYRDATESVVTASYSANPQSAFPWHTDVVPPDHWTAAQLAIAPRPAGTGPNGEHEPHFPAIDRWRGPTPEAPTTPHPQSAVSWATPRRSIETSSEAPQSAHPIRPKKRHGPAVSAAWQNNDGSTGKLRGRPPSNRSVQEGPYSTFPANPAKISTPTRTTNPFTFSSSPAQGQGQGQIMSENQRNNDSSSMANGSPFTPPSFGPGGTIAAASTGRKPSKLSLQVPQHSGGPVRLATPPRVLINGDSRPSPPPEAPTMERRSSADFFNQLDDDDDVRFSVDEAFEEETNVDWKKRAHLLKRKLEQKEEELQALRRRVLDAVM